MYESKHENRWLCAALIAGLGIGCISLSGKAHSVDSRFTTPMRPAVIVNLKKIGWVPPPSTTNRAFFKDFTTGKLVAMDYATRILFLNEDVVVVYQTKQE